MKRLILYTSVVFFVLAMTFAVKASIGEAKMDQDPSTGYVRYSYGNIPSIKVAPRGKAPNEFCSDHPKKEGAVRFNNSTSKLEYCDGVAWVTVGLSAPCPSGQLSTLDSAGKSICLAIACPDGQIVSISPVTGTFECRNLYGSMDCIITTDSVYTGHQSAAICSSGRSALGTMCARTVVHPKPKPPYGAEDDGLFTAEVLHLTGAYCVFENGNVNNLILNWPGLGVRGQTICCR